MVDAGVEKDGVDDAGGGVGDGEDDGGLPGVLPVDGLHGERGGEAFAQVIGGLGEEARGVGQFVDEGQVAVGQGRRVLDGLQFSFEAGLLVVTLAELLGEPVPDGGADRVGLAGQGADLGGDPVHRGLSLAEFAGQGLGAVVVHVVLLGLAGGDELGQPGGPVVAQGVLVEEFAELGGEHVLAD